MKITNNVSAAIAGLFLTTLLACSEFNQSNLIGKWQAVTVLEEGEPLEVDPDTITLSFSEDGYSFTSTLNYKEAGTYELKNRFLYTMDTLNRASTQKTVEIVGMEQDTLSILMLEKGKERLLKLARVD